jgi:hypothetical protein
VACLANLGRVTLAKGRKKRLREDREALLTRMDWHRKAQAAFNRYIRARDIDKGCISCGVSLVGRKFDAGHYLSRGAHLELSYNEDNTMGQCVPCNQFRSGAQLDYRKGLIARIGLERVLALEGPHELPKLDIPQIQEIERIYKAKYKALARAE